MKNVLKRLFAITLAICIVLPVFPQLDAAALAATSGEVTGLADENIVLSFSGDADNAWSATGTTITGSVVSVGGTCSDTSYNSTLTVTNKKASSATLSFDYTIEQNSGTIQVDGTVVSSGASFTKELEPNGTVKVYIKSGSTTATKITITNITLVTDVTATAKFIPAENGSYTVDGQAITAEHSNTQSSMTAYQVVATPANGYKFMGWYNVTDGKYINTSPKAALNIESDCTITAKFVQSNMAIFEVGGQVYSDLNEAAAYAQSNSLSKITLAADGSISGNYTIPEGITLLIPFDAAGTLYTEAPDAIRTNPKSKPFRTLTMAKGASITVNGAISLGGRYFAAGGGQQGRAVGDYGYIKMADDSSITVKNGGKLYAWGFISGSGSILAESGATVYEFYQIADFRGGSASSSMGHGVFPFSQYFVQNIEVPLTLNAGANEQVYSGVYAMSTTYTTAINFIGNNGMFKVASGSFTKDYDEKTDRLVFTVNGEAALNTLSLTLAGMDVNSASYVLPITNNITINIQSGNVTINQDAALLAGVEVNIAEGAGLTVANGKNIYFYDSDEWNSDNFVWGPCKFKSVAYAPGKAYNRSNNDLVDAKMDVNGSVTAIGAIYTTKGGADICSSNGTGKYIQQGTPGTETDTYQYNANSSAVTIPITAAKLHNADGSYTETQGASAGTTFYYDDGRWGTTLPTPKVTVTFDANNGKGTMEPQTVPVSTDTELTANAFTREGHDFKGWNTAADGSGTDYADKATVSLTEDTTLYAQWEIQKFTVTWKNWDGSVLETDENVEYGKTPEYNGEEPTKEGDAQYTYTFNGGWTPEIAAVTGDVTYTAVFEQTVNEYTVTWKNYDGSVLETDENVKYGTMPEYNGATPTKEGDAQYTYTFTGWTPEIAAVTGNAEYTAQFTKTVNKYTVTWKNWDGKVLKTEQVEYGATPEYNGDTPTKPTTEQYTYTFSGWDPDPKVSEVTGDATYTAQFTGTVNEYTVTWKNWDGTVLKTEQVEYGTTPKYNGDTPTKKGDAQYTYTFTGWDPEITAVTGNKEYTAVFEQTVNEYTVTWKNGDTVLKAEQVKYGTKPTYDGAPPTKKGDAQYTYTFKGWDPAVAAVTGDVTYEAQFDSIVNEYTVTWKNWDGSELRKDTLQYGAMPEYKDTPTKPATEQYTYTFTGWNPAVAAVTGDATYTAQFTETTRMYKITWVIDGKKETEEVAYGVKPTHAEPTKDTDEHYSYEFSGWQPAITDVSGDATYTATFTSTPVEYTITFDTDGGTPVAPIKQGYDKEITAPAAPTKTGYTFAGWDKEIPATMPAENMTIKALWTVNQYTITFNTDGGTEIASKTQNYGTDIAAPADPTKTGYTFVKWDRAIPATMPAEDVTITAQWKINQYTITFFDTDGVTEILAITQDYGTAITAPADPTKTGYTFAGWDRAIPATMPAENVTITAKWTVNQYTITLMVDGTEQITIRDDYGADISQYIGAINKEGYDFIGWAKEDGTLFTQTTMPAENLVLHACWGIKNQYTITFDTDGGTEIAPIIADYGTPIAAPADPTKIGYTFAGWDKDIPVTMPAENVTITAKWTINQYTIAFDTDGGSYIAPITQDYNTAVTAPENPSKTGYTFAGWDMAIPATMPAENVTIKAQWTINQYTITFDTDGGSTIESITQDYGTDIIAPAAPTKEGYVFDGWDKNIPATMPAENLYIKAKWKAKTYNITWIVDGQGTITTVEYNTLPSYGENDPTKTATAEYTYEFIGWEPELKLATEDATYTAEFREVPNIYTITWDVDGTKTNDSFAYGAAITAPADPTKEGYTFAGWLPELPEKMPAQNIVATAQWAKNKYKLTFEAEGYEGEPADVEWGTEIHAPADVSKEGHTLEGWYYTDGDEEKKFNFEADKMPMHDLTLTAKWTINQYTITFDTDGGNTIDSITLDYGTAITAPEAPTKDGYTFKEWSPALPETMPAEDMIVTAIYDYTYTGWITDEKGKTYLENGEKKYYQKWATIEGQEYYFNVEGYVVTGWQELDKDGRSTLFVFDDAGVFQNNMNGVNTNDAGDIYWVENGGVVKNAGLVRVEVPGGGVYYYFDPDNGGMAFKGSDDKPQCKVVYNNGLGLPAGNNYKFGNDGIIEHFEGYPNGIYQSGGDYYYCVDGVIIANGLMKIGEYYYYAKTSTGAFVCGQSYWITKTNDLLNEGIYSFDAQGRIVFPEEVKNGIVAENGSLYYYVDGKLTGAGLIQIDGDYYYVKTSNGEVVHGRNYWITTNNGLLPVDKYTFDEDGKLINPPVVNPNPGPEPEVKNGIVEEMGSLYYYVDGKLTGAGLIQIDGNYYYVKTSNCEVVHGRRYWITVTNNLLPAGQYKFAQDGKMVR